MESKRYPKIRFKGFSDAWVQRQVNDLSGTTYGGGTPKTTVKEYWKGNIPWIQSSDLIDHNVSDVLFRRFINQKAIDNSATKLIPKNSIAVVTRVGVGKLALITHSYTTSQDFLSLSNLKINNQFAVYLLYKKIQGDLRIVQGTSIKGITKEELLKKIVIIPNQEQEQQKIGDFFGNLDNLIALYQRKIEQLNLLKKEYLKEFFPQKDSKIPKYRFKGFTDDWELCKLGKLGKTYTGLSGKTKEDFGHGNAKFVTYMNVFSNPISDSNGTEQVEIDDKQNQVRFGDVFFTTSSETPEEVGMSSVWLDNTENIYLNSFCFGYRPSEKIDPYYLAFMLRSPSIRKKFRFLAQGISRYNISKNKVMEMSIPIPKYEEQIKVGSFFANLDHLITLHQRKLEQLQSIKKVFLNSMFI